MLELEIIKPKMLEMELLGQAPINSTFNTQEKEVTPTINVQEITPDENYDGLSKVTVNAVTNEIDANISSENILQGVSILGVEGILKPEKEEEVKTIEIKTNRLTSIKPTEGKTMGEVLVTTAVTPTKGDLDITENGQYDVSDYVGANVNVPIQEPKLQDKTVEITENGTFNIVADNGYDGLNNVEVVTNVAGGGDNTNLFIQEAEPSVKSGIWLQTNSTDIKNIKNINVIGEDINIDLGDWNAQSKFQQLPYNFYLGSTAIVGTDIYIFFNATSSSTNALYKYDTITNTYTKLNDVPFDSNRSTTSVIGTDIYIFGSTVSPNTQAYKYDTLKNTFTKLANTPYNTANASSVVYNNSIYIFGGSGGNKNVYRYDISTNSYTKLEDMIYTFSVGETAIVGDTVYMFGVGTEFLYMQKYNITTNTHTDLGQSSKNIPKCLAVPIGDYIFVLGSSYGDASSQTCYKFNTLDDTMIELSNIPYKFGQGRGGLVGNKIYLIGSKWTENMKRVQSVNVTIPEYNKDLVLLSSTNDNKYNTKLSNSIECDFEKCYIYSKNKSILPSKIASIYYGNNSSWVKTIQPEYVQDGLVALFDGDYAPDSNGRWMNKKGTDYIYEVNGKTLLHDTNKYKNNKSLTMMTSADYYKQGYTIEIVGKINSMTNSNGNTGGWFLTMNETGSWGIGVTEDTGKITFVNHTDVTEGKKFTGYYQKSFGASLYLEKTYNRGATGVKNTGQGSVNGCNWFSIQENTASGVGTTLTNHSILCYYARTSGSTYSVDGEIYCIRIYNRKLTNKELAYNHALDKEKYNLAD